jgi:RNA polymerase sigma-70 factor, ECF subfamily
MASPNRELIMNDSDEHLLLAVCKHRDVKAYNQIYKRFSDRIFAIGIKYTHNYQFAKDLSQEAMLKVWLKAPQYDSDRGSAKSWILTLARNQCFDMLRTQRRQPQNVTNKEDMISEETLYEPLTSHGEDSVQAAEIAQIEKLYFHLPDLQRAVVEQIYRYDRTHEEACEYLNIPLGTLKSRLRLGMKKLHAMVCVDDIITE